MLRAEPQPFFRQMLDFGKLQTGLTAGQRTCRPATGLPATGLSLMLVLAGVAMTAVAVPSMTSVVTTADAQ
jgi:hypothetical protein